MFCYNKIQFVGKLLAKITGTKNLKKRADILIMI